MQWSWVAILGMFCFLAFRDPNPNPNPNPDPGGTRILEQAGPAAGPKVLW